MVTVLARCVGDCSTDGFVTIDEIVTALNIALEVAPLDSCVALDGNGDGAVTVDELVAAINNALLGCAG
ncbi:MAG TPA: hypothetical protein VMT89_08425 [Candidatus Acidoferrales bacterium]|nr:hypothetical protein [Candidatus Acidoferrales bacterium]